jgi:hypothetical protein
MQPIIKFNGTIISIEIIDDEGTHYKKDIPNNDINKKLIKNTVFKFEKSGTQTIIMHDDNNVFHLSKMECKYSEFIEIKNKLENTEKEVNLLKQELSKNEKEMVDFKNDLLQQIKNNMVDFKNELFDTNNLLQKQIEKVNDKSVEDTQKEVFLLNRKITVKEELQQQINIYYDKELDRLECLEQELEQKLEQELNNNNDLLQQQIKLFNDKSIADKKEIDTINSKLNNTDSLLQQQIKILKDKSISDKKEIDTINNKLNNTDSLLQQQIKLFNDKFILDKKEIDTINNKLNNTDSLLQQQIKILKDKHKKEIDNLKDELNVSLKLLQQQMKLETDKSIEHKKEILQLNKVNQDIEILKNNSPIVFSVNGTVDPKPFYGDEQIFLCQCERIDGQNPAADKVWMHIRNNTNKSYVERISKILNKHFTITTCSKLILNSCYYYIIIPPKKILITGYFQSEYAWSDEPSFKIYTEGIYYNIEIGHLLWFGKEEDKTDIFIFIKK